MSHFKMNMCVFKEFTSDRIRFSFLKPDDANVLHQHLDWDVIKYLGAIPWPYTLQHAKEFIAHSEQTRNNNSCIDYLLTDIKTNAFIGIISLFLIVDDDKSLPGKIGYWVAHSQRGKGYAFEAVNAIVKLAKSLQLKQLWALVRQDNIPSLNLLNKVGMRFIQKRTGIYEGKAMAEVVYQISLVEDK